MRVQHLKILLMLSILGTLPTIVRAEPGIIFILAYGSVFLIIAVALAAVFFMFYLLRAKSHLLLLTLDFIVAAVFGVII